MHARVPGTPATQINPQSRLSPMSTAMLTGALAIWNRIFGRSRNSALAGGLAISAEMLNSAFAALKHPADRERTPLSGFPPRPKATWAPLTHRGQWLGMDQHKSSSFLGDTKSPKVFGCEAEESQSDILKEPGLHSVSVFWDDLSSYSYIGFLHRASGSSHLPPPWESWRCIRTAVFSVGDNSIRQVPVRVRETGCSITPMHRWAS